MVDREKKNPKFRPNPSDLEDVLAKRLRLLQLRLKEKFLDAFIISKPENKFYLTGWNTDSESGWIIISQNKSYLLTDSRYTEHATNQVSGFEIVEYDHSLPNAFGDLSKKLSFSKVGVESHDLSIFNFKRLRRFTKHLKLVPIAHLIEDLRTVKDESEISKLRKAVGIADKAFDQILNFLKPGMTEAEVAWSMEKFMREAGAERMAWEPFIVASGSHSSMAHWGAGERKIKNKDMVLVDYGCVYGGYYSDTSRVIFVGKPTDTQKEVYEKVSEAQNFGLNLVKAGKIGATIDKKVRHLLEKQTEHYYRHSLGHGVGLEVHELPRLSINSRNKLPERSTITVEPGIYIPGWGGVRLEDIVVARKGGAEILTKAPKDIKEVTI